jgi:hypothetical protein
MLRGLWSVLWGHVAWFVVDKESHAAVQATTRYFRKWLCRSTVRRFPIIMWGCRYNLKVLNYNNTDIVPKNTWMGFVLPVSAPDVHDWRAP